MVVMFGQNESQSTALLSRSEKTAQNTQIRCGREGEERRVLGHRRFSWGARASPSKRPYYWSWRPGVSSAAASFSSWESEPRSPSWFSPLSKRTLRGFTWGRELPGGRETQVVRHTAWHCCFRLKPRKGYEREGSRKVNFHSAEMRLNVRVFPQNSDKKGTVLGIYSVSENETVKSGRELSER